MARQTMKKAVFSGRRRLTRGMTTMELAVSSLVMVGVVYLSFDVMVTSAKLSKAGVERAAESGESRTGFDRLTDDLRRSDAILSEGDDDDDDSAGDVGVVMRIPATGVGGVLIPGEHKIVTYLYFASSRPDVAPGYVVRQEAVQRGGQTGRVVQETVATRVARARYQFLRAMTVEPVSGRFPLPLRPVSCTPVGGQMKITGISAPSLGIVSGELASLNLGLVSLTLGPLRISGNDLVVSGGLTATGPIDVLGEVDVEYSPGDDDVSVANVVRASWVLVDPERASGSEERTLETRVVLRNARH